MRMGAAGLVLGVVAWSALGAPSRDAALAAGGERLLRVGIWLPGTVSLNFADARVAIQVWAERWGRKSGVFTGAEVQVFEVRPETIASQVADPRWDAIFLPSEDFFATAERLGYVADYTIARTDSPGDVYVLVVRRDGGIREPVDLKGRRLIVANEHSSSCALVWLNRLLAGKGAPGLPALAASIVAEAKPAKQILPVFFGQADACLVSRHEFEAMAELNPQVGQKLEILATSPRLIPLVFSLGRGLNSREREALQTSVRIAQGDPDFRQLLMLHRMRAFEPIDRAALDTTRELWEWGRSTGAPAKPTRADARRSRGPGGER